MVPHAALRAVRKDMCAAGLAAALLAPAVSGMAAVDDPDSVDALRADPSRPFVYMIIVQDREWSPETRVMIGDKITGYMRYVLGGQLVRDTPEAAGMTVRIVLVSETAPAGEDVSVLEVFRQQTAAAGIDFVWGGEADLRGMVDEP